MRHRSPGAHLPGRAARCDADSLRLLAVAGRHAAAKRRHGGMDAGAHPVKRPRQIQEVGDFEVIAVGPMQGLAAAGIPQPPSPGV